MGAPMAGSIDLACVSGPRAAGWQAAKKLFRGMYEGPDGSPLVLPSIEQMGTTLKSAISELKAANAFAPDSDECGLGRLCLQLMSVATIEDPIVLAQLFQGMEQLASPVLTMLLDVPLTAIGQAARLSARHSVESIQRSHCRMFQSATTRHIPVGMPCLGWRRRPTALRMSVLCCWERRTGQLLRAACVGVSAVVAEWGPRCILIESAERQGQRSVAQLSAVQHATAMRSGLRHHMS